MFNEKRKSRKNAFAVIALLLGGMMALTLIGCDNGNSGNGNNGNPYNPYGDEGTGWPSSKLSTYGLGGMSQPSGMSAIEWWEYDHYTGYDYPVIYITFNGVAGTNTAIQQYFVSNGWISSGGSYEGMSSFSYTKNTAAAYHYFDSSSSMGWIIAGYPAE